MSESTSRDGSWAIHFRMVCRQWPGRGNINAPAIFLGPGAGSRAPRGPAAAEPRPKAVGDELALRQSLGSAARPVPTTGPMARYAVADQWGRMIAVKPVRVIDGLLAATALVDGLTPVTRNDRNIATSLIWRDGTRSVFPNLGFESRDVAASAFRRTSLSGAVSRSRIAEGEPRITASMSSLFTSSILAFKIHFTRHGEKAWRARLNG